MPGNFKVLALVIGALAGPAQASLVNLGDGTVKDTNTNLIWLRDWNINGELNWETQRAWAESLSLAGSNDWVLPSISEYAALFSAYGDLTSNLLPFDNVRLDGYWSGTEIVPGILAYGFFPDSGFQSADFERVRFFAVAVRPGDVAAAPEPTTLALVGAAFLGMAAVRRRKPSALTA